MWSGVDGRDCGGDDDEIECADDLDIELSGDVECEENIFLNPPLFLLVCFMIISVLVGNKLKRY